MGSALGGTKTVAGDWLYAEPAVVDDGVNHRGNSKIAGDQAGADKKLRYPLSLSVALLSVTRWMQRERIGAHRPGSLR